ncbi:uncharacterized protein EDB91DRAFT_1086000 [Suillus paluster]|uniref:uncharacterized protein n=1 Tax=Suillus paluster TaxID=48578 RepID=UPI001B878DDB|nr:uncharacterized protein EDB91DRAFT_1086000 [Suillus paluster]KAG1728760.1 hypothetical protein EDB91DRAFT_1086000 [Suillus paluster]
MSPKRKPSSATSTPASVLQKLQNSPGGFYAATPRLIHHVKYFIGGQDGNILISKGGGLQPTEFIIRGMFKISHNDFNFTPDANFNPLNVFHGCFADVKLSCHLTAGHNNAFRFSSEDFPDVLDNLAYFEGLIPRVNKEHPEQDTTSEVDGDNNYLTNLDGLSSDFDITTWPVADRCKGCLQDLTSTHIIRPLPAYDLDHNLILPSEYESKLKGALVEVHMAFCHHQVKSTKHDIFSAVLRELTILSPPAAMPSSPFKIAVLLPVLNSKPVQIAAKCKAKMASGHSIKHKAPTPTPA